MKDTREGLDTSTPEGRQKSNILLVDYFFELIKENNLECSFEIGAFSAQFSRDLYKKLPNTKIYAFEANPYNYDHFLKKNDFLGINYINKAISNFSGKCFFNIQESIGGVNVGPIRGNNSLLEKNNKSITYKKVEIDCVTLYDFIIENNLSNKPSVLWIDVEGAAREVLGGCEKVLEQVSLIFIEVEEILFWKNQWLDIDINSFLNNKGFELIARDGEYPKQYNQIYRKKV